MNSFGLCACSIEPGPQMTVATPCSWKRPASVPNDTSCRAHVAGQGPDELLGFVHAHRHETTDFADRFGNNVGGPRVAPHLRQEMVFDQIIERLPGVAEIVAVDRPELPLDHAF